MEKIKDKWKDQSLIIKIFIVLTIMLAITSVISLNNIKMFQIIPFYLFGIWSLMFLIISIYLVLKKINLKFNKKFIIYSSIILLCCSLMYVYIIKNTKQIYTWDQRCYYELQIELLKKFETKFLSGIKSIIVTTYKEDYGSFLLSFTSMIFNFTDKREYSIKWKKHYR